MMIGNLPSIYGRRGQLTLRKWYFWIELRKHPPSMIRVFRPWLYLGFIKIIDWGEPGRIDGRHSETRGWWKDYTFPYGISIEIIK